MSIIGKMIDDACRCKKCKLTPAECTCVVRVSCATCGAKRTFKDHPDFCGEKVVVLDACPDCLASQVRKKTTILVCGGRDYDDWRKLRDVLDSVANRFNVRIRIVHGGATGADALAARWASEMAQDAIAYPADWKAHGKAAGPIRNARMLEQEKPALVVAFPGGRGTADMVRRAKAAGVEVLVIGTANHGAKSDMTKR